MEKYILYGDIYVEWNITDYSAGHLMDTSEAPREKAVHDEAQIR
jgi:hypothetical protein